MLNFEFRCLRALRASLHRIIQVVKCSGLPICEVEGQGQRQRMPELQSELIADGILSALCSLLILDQMVLCGVIRICLITALPLKEPNRRSTKCRDGLRMMSAR